MERYSKLDSAFIIRWAKKIKAIDLLGGKCKKCGNNNIFQLDFHHNKGDKEDKMAHLLGAKRWNIVKREALKCILLCRNCHLELHYPSNLLLKEKLIKIKGIDHCEECKYKGKSLASLDFHHQRGKEKKFRIGESYGTKSLEDIIIEMDKCSVLCRNCHSLKHVSGDRFNKLKKYIDEKVENYKELQPKLDRDLIKKMYYKEKMKQIEIVQYFKCSKGTISSIIKGFGVKK